MGNTTNMVKIAIGNANWDYYLEDGKYVYYIAKSEKHCSSGYFGKLDFFLKTRRFHEMAVLTVEAIEVPIELPILRKKLNTPDASLLNSGGKLLYITNIILIKKLIIPKPCNIATKIINPVWWTVENVVSKYVAQAKTQSPKAMTILGSNFLPNFITIGAAINEAIPLGAVIYPATSTE